MGRPVLSPLGEGLKWALNYLTNLTSSDVGTVYLNAESDTVLSKPDPFFPFMMKADTRLHCLRNHNNKKNPVY